MVSVFFQTVFNTELMRYTLATANLCSQGSSDKAITELLGPGFICKLSTFCRQVGPRRPVSPPERFSS